MKREAARLPPKTAYDLGETIGRCLFRPVSGYLDYRLSQLTVKTLPLFETIHDEPDPIGSRIFRRVTGSDQDRR